MNKISLSLLLAIFISTHSYAFISMQIEPIVGYERVQKLIPDKHTVDRLHYGARLSLGVPFLAGEATYIRAYDTEEFPSDNLTVKDTTDKAQLGLRGSFKLIGVIRASARVGGQASQNVHEEIVSGVSTKTTETIKVHPYAGAGLIVQLGRLFQFKADVTTVFTKWPDMNYNEYQATAGFAVKFP